MKYFLKLLIFLMRGIARRNLCSTRHRRVEHKNLTLPRIILTFLTPFYLTSVSAMQPPATRFLNILEMHEHLQNTIPAIYGQFSGNAYKQEEVAASESYNEEKPAKIDHCHHAPYSKGCMFFGLGLIIGSQNNATYFGASGNWGYFLINRLATRLNGEFTIYSNYNQYEAGPDLMYFFGPYFGWVLAPGYGVRGIWLNGAFSGAGHYHGPLVNLTTRFTESVTIGVEIFYTFINFKGIKSEETKITPRINFSF